MIVDTGSDIDHGRPLFVLLRLKQGDAGFGKQGAEIEG
ncbi:hypothetical protein IMCC12053_1637 [Celeribacter marinus]|uniref:Uncharacterized protein n=1 Tax=Celeribacter marinus TaxID=1397108 RepID=A0A0P0AA37_9RHOB|nr:hypothetical protein IMCC12053_1637 [Celeribacter marinus]